MNKVLKKLTVLVCALVLAVMPASSVFAATNSIPVLVSSSPGAKAYQFQPSPLDLSAGQVVYLMDNGSTWNVAAGQQFSLTCNAGGSFNVKIYKTGYGFVYDSYVSDWFYYDSAVEQQSTSYIVFVVAQSASWISHYSVIIH